VKKFIVYLVMLVMFVVVVQASFMMLGTDATRKGGQFVPHVLGHHLKRISQLDPRQYASTQEFDTWAYSTCSTAAMTEVMNYYGRHYRITDVLRVERQLAEITPALGLLEDAGIARTVARFGFETSWGYSRTLDQIVALAHQGTPVIVAFPPSRYPGGHVLVVTGGNDRAVYVADSSVYNITSFTRSRFLQLWAGFAAVVTL
jgi:predicted double-glycine peptidase